MTTQRPLFSIYGAIVLLCIAATAVIFLTASALEHYAIVGKTVPFAYPWRLKMPTFQSHLTAWLGYALHNLAAWVIIALAARQKPGASGQMRWFNWAMCTLHLVGFGLHWLQTRLWYDGLAQDVPEVTALGSVALMLIVILILETPRRGLAFGKKVKFHKRFLYVVRKYHGYLFTWALIYTFWYHPFVATPGHLMGFFYMFMLFGQSVLLFHRGHFNKWWTLSLELLVLPHGAIVALYQQNAMWPMFAFGFGAMFFLSQIHGLGWQKTTRLLWHIGFLVATVAVYAWMGRLAKVHEIIRIPFIDYATVGLLYLLFLGVNLFLPKSSTQT